MDVLLIRADFTTENDTEIKICSPQSHVLSGYSYQSYTRFRIEQVHHHSMFCLLAKRKLSTHKIWVNSTQGTLLLSVEVSVHHIWPTFLYKHYKRGENRKEKENTFVLPTRHKFTIIQLLCPNITREEKIRKKEKTPLCYQPGIRRYHSGVRYRVSGIRKWSCLEIRGRW